MSEGLNLWSLEELEQAETISVGQTDNLKIDLGGLRVWLSRCTVADGEPYDNRATVERLIDGRWTTTHSYRAR